MMALSKLSARRNPIVSCSGYIYIEQRQILSPDGTLPWVPEPQETGDKVLSP